MVPQSFGAPYGRASLLWATLFVLECIRAEDMISDEDMAKCRGLFDEPLPQKGDMWTELHRGIPEGMRVWGALKEGTNVFTFRVSGQMAGVSVEGLIKTMEGMDYAERKSWDSTCLRLDKLANEGDNELFVWLVDFPWPIFDREYVIRRRLDRHDDGGAASISRVVNDSAAVLSEDPANVRIKDFLQLAAARPLPGGGGVSFQLLYRNDLHAPIPQWLITWFSTLALPTYLKQIKAQAIAYTQAGA